MCSHHIHIDDYSKLPCITHETYPSIALKIITPTITTITHEMYLSIALNIITSTPTQNDHTCTQRDHPSGVLNQYHQHYHPEHQIPVMIRRTLALRKQLERGIPSGLEQPVAQALVETCVVGGADCVQHLCRCSCRVIGRLSSFAIAS